MIKEICSWLPPGLDGRKVCMLRDDVAVKELAMLFYFMTSSSKSVEILLSNGSAWILMPRCSVVTSSFARGPL